MKKTTTIIIALLLFTNGYFIGSDRIKIFDYLGKKHHKDLVLFGDSRIQNGDWAWYTKRLDIQKSGYPGFTTSDLTSQLQDGVFKYHPKTCIIQAGINDILLAYRFNTQPDSTQYRDILESLLVHGIKPIVTSTIYIHNPKYAESYNTMINNAVDRMNSFLQAFCQHHHLQYIDLNKSLSINHGLDARYAIADGVHLNDSGYAIFKHLTLD